MSGAIMTIMDSTSRLIPKQIREGTLNMHLSSIKGIAIDSGAKNASGPIPAMIKPKGSDKDETEDSLQGPRQLYSNTKKETEAQKNRHSLFYISSRQAQPNHQTRASNRYMKYDRPTSLRQKGPSTRGNLAKAKKVSIAALPAVDEDSDEEYLDSTHDENDDSTLEDLWPETMEDSMRFMFRKREVFVLAVLWFLYLSWILGFWGD